MLDNGGFITASATGASTTTDAVFATGMTQFANEETGNIQGTVQMDNSVNMAQLFAGSSITGDLLIGTNTDSVLILDGSSPSSYSYSTAVTGSTQFSGTLVKQGSGIWALDENVNQNLTLIYDGFINFNSLSVFGTGNITLDGGGLQWASGFTGDVSSLLNTLGAAGGILDANGNTGITLASVISGSGGPLQFVNSSTAAPSTFTLTATNTYTGETIVGGTFAGGIHVLADNPGALGSGTATISSFAGLAGNRRLGRFQHARGELRLVPDGRGRDREQ